MSEARGACASCSVRPGTRASAGPLQAGDRNRAGRRCSSCRLPEPSSLSEGCRRCRSRMEAPLCGAAIRAAAAEYDNHRSGLHVVCVLHPRLRLAVSGYLRYLDTMYRALALVEHGSVKGTWVLEAIDEADGGLERAQFSGYNAHENALATASALYPTTKISLDQPL